MAATARAEELRVALTAAAAKAEAAAAAAARAEAELKEVVTRLETTELASETMQAELQASQEIRIELEKEVERGGSLVKEAVAAREVAEAEAVRAVATSESTA